MLMILCVKTFAHICKNVQFARMRNLKILQYMIDKQLKVYLRHISERSIKKKSIHIYILKIDY